MFTRAFTLLPAHLIVAVAYMVLVATFGVEWLYMEHASFRTPAGPVIHISGERIIVMVSIVALMLEIVKSASTGIASVMNHILSTIVFIVCFGAMLTVPMFATFGWGALVLMTFVDVVTGTTVTIFAARRDLEFSD